MKELVVGNASSRCIGTLKRDVLVHKVVKIVSSAHVVISLLSFIPLQTAYQTCQHLKVSSRYCRIRPEFDLWTENVKQFERTYRSFERRKLYSVTKKQGCLQKF